MFYYNINALHFKSIFWDDLRRTNLKIFRINKQRRYLSQGTGKSNQQDRQYRYNVHSDSFKNDCYRGKERNITYLSVCAAAAARARGHVNVRAHARVALFIQHATGMLYIVSSFVAPLAIFFDIVSQTAQF